MFELADVARPGMTRKGEARVLGERREAPPHLLEEMFGEGDHVFGARTQRRHIEANRRQAEIQVLPERAGADPRLEVLVRRDDDPRGRSLAAIGADGTHLSRVEESEELGLQLQAERVDLVEEDRPGARRPNEPRALRLRAGEGAALMPEQLRLGEPFRECRAVDRIEGCISTIRSGVQRTRDDVFAAAGRPHEQRRALRTRGLLDTAEQTLENDRSTHENGLIGPFGSRLLIRHRCMPPSTAPAGQRPRPALVKRRSANVQTR
jgi:hypothetical protein